MRPRSRFASTGDGHFLQGCLRQFLIFIQAGKLLQALQPELKQEIPGGLVQNGSADHVPSPAGGYQLLFDQGLHDGCRIDSANFLDLRESDRLPVGNDGQGLQGRQRESDRGGLVLQKFPDPEMMLRLGRHLVAAGDFPDFNSVPGRRVMAAKMSERLANGSLVFLSQQFDHGSHRDGFLRQVDQRFHDRSQLFFIHAELRCFACLHSPLFTPKSCRSIVRGHP